MAIRILGIDFGPNLTCRECSSISTNTVYTELASRPRTENGEFYFLSSGREVITVNWDHFVLIVILSADH